MVTAFDTACEVLFSDPNLGESGTYTPNSGAAVSLKVIRNSRKMEQVGDPFGRVGHHIPAHSAEVLVRELAAEPEDGDCLQVGDEKFKVRSAEQDEEKLVWRLNLDKVG